MDELPETDAEERSRAPRRAYTQAASRSAHCNARRLALDLDRHVTEMVEGRMRYRIDRIDDAGASGSEDRRAHSPRAAL
jgi:hypothetical protein